MLITNLKSTKYRGLQETAELPLIGSFFTLIFSFIPGLFIVFISDDDYIVPLAYSVCGLWTYTLEKYDIKIDLFFLPAWIFYLILSFMVSL